MDWRIAKCSLCPSTNANTNRTPQEMLGYIPTVHTDTGKKFYSCTVMKLKIEITVANGTLILDFLMNFVGNYKKMCYMYIP